MFWGDFVLYIKNRMILLHFGVWYIAPKKEYGKRTALTLYIFAYKRYYVFLFLLFYNIGQKYKIRFRISSYITGFTSFV